MSSTIPRLIPGAVPHREDFDTFTPLPCTVGLEVEFNSCRNPKELAAALAPYDFQLKKDGSCGEELVSGVVTSLEELLLVSGRVEYSLGKRLSGVQVSNCGYHVHVGLRDKAKKHGPEVFERVKRMAVHFERVFLSFAPDRAGNTYCRPFTDDEVARAQSNPLDIFFTNERYRWFNPHAYSKHGTVEFRLMKGTLDPMHMAGWATLCSLAVATAAAGAEFPWTRTGTRDELLAALGCFRDDAGPVQRTALEWADAR